MYCTLEPTLHDHYYIEIVKKILEIVTNTFKLPRLIVADQKIRYPRGNRNWTLENASTQASIHEHGRKSISASTALSCVVIKSHRYYHTNIKIVHCHAQHLSGLLKMSVMRNERFQLRLRSKTARVRRNKMPKVRLIEIEVGWACHC